MVKYFLIIIVLAAVELIPGRVVKNKKPSVNVTQMPELVPNTFNQSLGACSYRQILNDTESCQRSFYMSYRTNADMSCEERHLPFEDCMMKEAEMCLKPVLSTEKFKEAIKEYELELKHWEQFACGVNEHKVNTYFKTLIDHETCSEGFRKEFDDCSTSFHVMFKKSPGDIRLCREYKKNTECMKRIIEKHCNLDFSITHWMFDDSLNPFCDDKQMKILKQGKQ